MEPNQTNPTNTPPIVPQDELKMPEEQFGAPEAEHGSSRTTLFALIAILIVLLGILGTLLVWGDTIVDAVMGTPSADERGMVQEPVNNLQPEPAAPTTAEELSEIEAEIESTDFEEFDAELDAIDAEFEAEAE